MATASPPTLWDLATGEPRPPLTENLPGVSALAFSPDGKTLAVAAFGSDYPLKLWDVASRRELVAYRGHTHEIRAIAFSPDGKLVASAGLDNTIKLWDANPAR